MLGSSIDRQPPYAPSPYSFPTEPRSRLNINLDEEIPLYSTPAERDLLDSLTEIYSIIITLDGLERHYNRDSISGGEYTEICTRLLNQYKSILKDEDVNREFGSLEEFVGKWDMEVPRARERLRIGLPSTIASPSHPSHSTPTQSAFSVSAPTPSVSTSAPPPPSGAKILTATENFITFLDALRLNMVSKDSLHPLLSEVIQSVNAVTGGEDFEGRGKIVGWLIRLNGMRANEELGEEEARQLSFEMEGAYAGFKGVVGR